MFDHLRRMSRLDLLGARYYDNTNDGLDGNNGATEAMGFQNNRYVGDVRMSSSTNDDIEDSPANARNDRTHLLCVSMPSDDTYRTHSSMLSKFPQSVSMKSLLRLMQHDEPRSRNNERDLGTLDSRPTKGRMDQIDFAQSSATTFPKASVHFDRQPRHQYSPQPSDTKFKKFFQKVDQEIHALSSKYSYNDVPLSRKGLLKANMQSATLSQIMNRVGLEQKKIPGSNLLHTLLTSEDSRFDELLQNETRQVCEQLHGLPQLVGVFDSLVEKLKLQNRTLEHDSQTSREKEITHLEDVDDSLRYYRSELEANGVLRSEVQYLQHTFKKADQLKSSEQELQRDRDISSQILSLIQKSIFDADNQSLSWIPKAQGLAREFKSDFDLPNPRKALLSFNTSRSIQVQQSLQADLDDINRIIIEHENEHADLLGEESSLRRQVEKRKEKLREVFPIATHRARARLGLKVLVLLQELEAAKKLRHRTQLIIEFCRGNSVEVSRDPLSASPHGGKKHPTSTQTSRKSSVSPKEKAVALQRPQSDADMRMEKQLSDEINDDIRSERLIEKKEDSGIASVASMIIDKP
ncbi:hypothetical protein GUITHDRAFT_105805 [Guillardia theta CCMP2712]|uniref:Uncharacterized protein n=1 Tax=Guillardia theta (strain CCMP2712) TaxID=905079 RepID=L1JJ63_GUITC|nr:hypothetical protein GUITHDRAFT_105805 [Guillardia theta CCMP2712]EKX48194.1 hypothetical protein GUITHDRAFT_105805 [Guillardia theta CCMP2712]|eukprot:XP_005835174.1 hypothetical protein GUITHDRAFT_105805 [Guillardia theta CCMP2712]